MTNNVSIQKHELARLRRLDDLVKQCKKSARAGNVKLLESNMASLLDVETYTKLDCVASTGCKSASETFHRR